MDQFPIKHKMDHNISQILMKKTIKRERISKFCVGSSFLLLHPQVLCMIHDGLHIILMFLHC